MKKLRLGKTGLTVNRMGFGGIPIQRVSEEEAFKTVLHAVENGVDFIDTSRLYTSSEHRIGLALQQTDKKVVLATKSNNRTADGIQKDIQISLKELQTDFIDIYQAHAISNKNDYEKIISSGGALEGLRKAKAEGHIGHIGATCPSQKLDPMRIRLKNHRQLASMR
jgi:aryl-alcohol dehydrogenase-like predicted oxidoreductase